jgi:hypothetical protein
VKPEIAAVVVERRPENVSLVSSAYGELARGQTGKWCLGVQQIAPRKLFGFIPPVLPHGICFLVKNPNLDGGKAELCSGESL